jgi:hypothetical protein
MTVFFILTATVMAAHAVAIHSIRRTVQDVCSVVGLAAIGTLVIASGSAVFPEHTSPVWVWVLSAAVGAVVGLRDVYRRRQGTQVGGLA